MPRKLKPTKPLIYVFCEGKSEQAYTSFLSETFKDVAVIKVPSFTGLFDEAKNKFAKAPEYHNYIEVTNEIWFFFDAEIGDAGKWEHRAKIIKELSKLRKKPGIRVRLLMTTGCIEYWLMLHYKMYAPSLKTVAEKERVIDELKAKVPNYRKGDNASTEHIAVNYPTATKNAEKTIHNLLEDGLPGTEDTEERNRWLLTCCPTFSTVYEAINYLESLRHSSV